MANHPSALKRIRSSETKRVVNKYYGRTMRSAVKKFRALKSKEEADKEMPEILSLIDKNAKRNIIHKNKAANLKSKLMKHANSLS